MAAEHEKIFNDTKDEDREEPNEVRLALHRKDREDREDQKDRKDVEKRKRASP